MKRPLADFSTEPLFNIKAVERQTGIAAATLRAWERRYKLIVPQRTRSGYRLYSEQHIALLNWIREQMLAGLTISRAVAMLRTRRANSETIWIETPTATPLPAQDAPLSCADSTVSLYDALVTLDSARADQIMSQAFAMYSAPEVCLSVIIPTRDMIGDAWARGEILVTYERFASNYLVGRLLTLLQTFATHEKAPHIIVGCAPGERHEIGALIFAVLARQRGYRISYLGQNVPIEDVAIAATQTRPAMVVLTATRRESALAMAEAQHLIADTTEGQTLFGYGGRAFDHDPDLREQVPGTYFGENLGDAVTSLHDIVPLER